MQDWAGVVFSFLFVFLVIGIASVLLARKLVTPAAARKIIHIGVSNWWIIAVLTIEDPLAASIGPLVFILINALSLRFRTISAMEQGQSGNGPGTVYFPISLLILVNLSYRGILPMEAGGVGVLVMGWGDGMASLVGQHVQSSQFLFWGQRKSVAGAAAMFLASFAVVLACTVAGEIGGGFEMQLLIAAVTAMFALLIEFFTPFGLDNLTVPILTALFYTWTISVW